MVKRIFLKVFLIVCFLHAFSVFAKDKDFLKGYKKDKLVFSKNTHNLTVTDLGSAFALTATGDDPYVFFDATGNFCRKNKPYVIAFEYIYTKDAGRLDFFCNIEGQKQATHFSTTIKKSEAWKWFLMDISKKGKGLGAEIQWLRIDPPEPGMKIRNMHIVKADMNLLRRAAVGDFFGSLDTLGIKIKSVTADSCGMETVRYSDKKSYSIVRSVYSHLDLDARSKQVEMNDHVKAFVPFGPVIAAGEGEHPDNHTVVRILSQYQLREIQFLAYPPSVKGGVGINSVSFGNNKYGFVCHPLTDKNSRTIKLFNRYGGLVKDIRVADDISAPFIVAAGDFLKKNPGDEIAVSSRFCPGSVRIYAVSGKMLIKLDAPVKKSSTDGFHIAVLNNNNSLTGSSGNLVYQDIRRGTAYLFDGASSFTRYLDLDKIPKGARVFESAFTEKICNAGQKQNLISTLYSITKNGRTNSTDIGLRENSFCYNLARSHGSWRSEWPKIPDTKYVREIKSDPYFHPQDWSQVAKSGNIKNRSRNEWLKGLDWNKRIFLAPHLRKMGRPLNEYTQRSQTYYDPHFTHRWGIYSQKALMDRIGERGLPEYLCLDRKNELISGGYFGHTMFKYGSYNFEQPELRDYYHLVLWEFFRQLGREYRKKPENLFIAKPSHENEVESGAGSLGDYNLHNVRGFYRYLLAMYGDLATINKVFGTSYTADFFDPPRNFMRGEWDDYSGENDLFMEWIEYNRINVYRQVGEALLGVVMAGIPPQLTRTHQIPGKYLMGGMTGINDNAGRITPVDWMLTAGTGFGYTRYQLWYENKRNMADGAWSSGFDDFFIGEYASITDDAKKAWEQLKYAVDHGMKGALVMSWPDYKNVGYNEAQYAALQRLHKEYGDKPLSGLAGGISEIRGYKGDSGTYDIAALGCSDKNTGLLKSIRTDGSFEGTVYVVPFHSHVDIAILADKQKQTVGKKPVKLCDLKNIRQGCVVEINFTIPKGKSANTLELRLYRNNEELTGQRTLLKDQPGGKNIRVIYKFPVIMRDLTFAVSSRKGSVELENVRVFRHQDMAVNLSNNIWTGTRHKGGVRFDIIGK